MRGYFVPLIACFVILFLSAWAFVRFDYNSIASAEYQITKAHQDFVAGCNLGDIDIIGDSTVNADLIPSRIGPQLRVLGLGGGTPVEIYYAVQSLLKCRNHPRIVIFQFAPSSFGGDPAYPYPQKTYFWEKAFAFQIIDFQNAMEILRYSKKFNNSLFTGPASIFDIDYRIKAYLYSARFPTYFMPDLQHFMIAFLQGRSAEDNAVNLELYDQTVLDEGHHFYGTGPDGNAELDHDSGRADDQISPLTNFYFRRTIEALAGMGIKIFLLEPPREQTSFDHYPPGLVDIYLSYLTNLQSSEPSTRLIGNGFQVWGAKFFGDESHLNLRGSLIFSAMTRDTLDAAAVPGIFAAAALQPKNLYATAPVDLAFWTKPATDPLQTVTLSGDAVLPELAYPASVMAWRYHVQPSASLAEAPGIQGPSDNLTANTYYAVSVMIKNANADSASLQIDWPGGFNGRLTWNFLQRAQRYSGEASEFNSGVSLCPGGWVELFLSARTGPASGSYPGPVILLSATHEAAAELYNPTLERGLWPTNYCRLQPGETQTALPETEKIIAAN